jgi:hypothetical protein
MSRELPQNMISQSTRNDKNWHKDMMSKFKKLNDEYNKRAEGEFSKDISVVDNNILKFDEENVFYMIKKAKEDIKTINENNNNLNKKINEYDECKKDCDLLIESIQKLSDTYYNLSTKSQLFDIVNKLQIKQHLIDVETSSSISLFENDIQFKIDELKEQVKNNKQKISDFKKLVLNCMDEDDEKEKECEKNICNICVARKINTCLNPCGHTFCLTCVDKMNNKCGMCRTTFISKIKMYIANDDEELDEFDNEDNDNDNYNDNDVTDLVEGFSGFTWTSLANTINYSSL